MSGRSSKVKGATFERQLVNEAKARGLDAERAYASNGRALGEGEGVDVKIQGCRVQAKRRRSLASYLKPPPDADVCIFREDRGDTYVLMRYPDFLDILQDHGW